MANRPTIFVAVPFYYEQQRFKILKGKRWGAIDHLLLQAIVKQPASAQQLAKASNLPKRLIIEVLIPLMKAGWLELVKVEKQFSFVATSNGKAVATLEELPLEKEPITSIRQYIIDPCTSDCYRVGHRQQAFQLYNEKRLGEILPSKGSFVATLSFPKPYKEAHHADIFDCVSDGDEEAVAIDDTYIRISRDNIRYGLVSVDDSDRIGNAPINLSDDLTEQILMTAHKKSEELELLGTQTEKQHSMFTFQGSKIEKNFPAIELKRDDVQLILGADEHKAALEISLKTASTRLIIHSTFINPANLKALTGELFSLAKRSVKIDILWGQVEPSEGKDLQPYQQTRDSLSEMVEHARLEGLDTLINVHLEPTASHSKFIIYDDPKGDYSVFLGSCNWLNSNFTLFEASVKISSTAFASDMLRISSSLAQGISKVSNLFSRELSTLANSVARKSIAQQNDPSEDLVSVKLILKNEHYDLVRRARDEAKIDIVVCSHRFSHIAQRPVITPLITSTNGNSGVKAKIFYGRTSGGLTENNISTISEAAKDANINIEKIALPAIHAKILAWDSDNFVITSLNWLSASAYGNDYDEIGVHVEGHAVAEEIKSIF
ncbi:phospholipase D-like domain-containing protein [Pseudomonas paralactis]|uniref:phospholipase D-like domain-containing protein n=1 Tax=Pseudomonas paralactis TaxID=1615673 RepID=UPI000A634730|nr:phospholipase D-like domain-containing protein [Pseudomonas paralactis]